MHLALSLVMKIITCLLLQQVTPSNAKDFRETRSSSALKALSTEMLENNNGQRISSAAASDYGQGDFEAPVVLWTGAKIPSNESVFIQASPSELRLNEGQEPPFRRRTRLKDKPPHRHHHHFTNRHKTKSGLLIESNSAAVDFLLANDMHDMPSKDEGGHYERTFDLKDVGGGGGGGPTKLPLPFPLPLTNVSLVSATKNGGKRGEGRKRNKPGQNPHHPHHPHHHHQRKRKGWNGDNSGTGGLEVDPNRNPDADVRHRGRQRQKLQRNGKLNNNKDRNHNEP